MIETIIGITVTAIMNGVITTECGYRIANAFAVRVNCDGKVAGDKEVQEPV